LSLFWSLLVELSLPLFESDESVVVFTELSSCESVSVLLESLVELSSFEFVDLSLF
jgi:hypothetical protein